MRVGVACCGGLVEVSASLTARGGAVCRKTIACRRRKSILFPVFHIGAFESGIDAIFAHGQDRSPLFSLGAASSDQGVSGQTDWPTVAGASSAAMPAAPSVSISETSVAPPVAAIVWHTGSEPVSM